MSKYTTVTEQETIWKSAPWKHEDYGDNKFNLKLNLSAYFKNIL